MDQGFNRPRCDRLFRSFCVFTHHNIGCSQSGRARQHRDVPTTKRLTLPAPTVATGNLLTAEAFPALADVPAELEWFAQAGGQSDV
jgi:hypothetical protein